jgi:hypothetical protein
MSRRSRTTHPGIGSGKSRTDKPDELDLSRVAGAQEMLEQLQQEDEEQEPAEAAEVPAELMDLKELIFLGRSSQLVEFGGYKFEIQTLTTDQKRDLVKDLSLTGKDIAVFIRPYTLARAIGSINGVPLERLYEVYGGEEEADSIDRRLFVLDKLQSVLIEKLFAEYEKLVEKSDSIFTPESAEDKKKLKK